MKTRLKNTKHQLLYLIPVLGTIIWLLVCWQIRSSILYRFEDDNQKTFLKNSALLEEKVLSYIHGLQGMAGLVIARDYQPEPQLVRKYAVYRHFFTNFPGSMGYGFIRQVEHKDLKSYLDQQHKKRPFFKFRQLSPHENEHFIIEYIEPFENNSQALGLDVSSEKNRREAAQFAIKNNVPTLTAPIILVQAEKKGAGFLFYLPVYDVIPAPNTEEGRIKSFIGWAYTPILADSILNYLDANGNHNLTYSIFDVTDPQNPELIIKDKNSPKDFNQNPFKTKIKLGGRTWAFGAAIMDTFYLKLADYIFVMIFLIGALFWLFSLVKFRKFLVHQQLSEEKIDKIESWQEAVLNGTNMAIIATDLNGLITLYNPAAEQLLGYTAEEMVNKQTPKILHLMEEVASHAQRISLELRENIPPGFQSLTAKTRTTGKVETNEWTFVLKSGEQIPVKLSVKSITDSQGEPSGYLGIFEDLREVKRMEHVIADQQAAIVTSAKMSALGEMAAGIGHEINNPLGIIASRISLMRMKLNVGQLPQEEIQDQFSKIDSTIERISKIISGLKTFSRDSSKEDFQLTAIDKIISDTLELCHERFNKNGIPIEYLGAPGVELRCRPIQISQVFMNLLSNTFDAIKELPEKWVKIEVKPEKSGLKIIFTDSGKGISPDIAQKIMTPFYTTKDIGKGTGLGLSISKGIIEAHGGRLILNNQCSNTQFLIELPYEPLRK